MSLPATAQDCPGCAHPPDVAVGIVGPRLPEFRVADSAPVVLRLRSAACGDLPDVSLVIREIRALEERAFARAESLAQFLQNCPAGQSVARRNPARLCEARRALQFRGRNLDAAADALARAGALLDAARARSQLPEEALSAQLALAGNAALDLLRRADLARSENGTEWPEPSAWAAAADDIAGIGEMLRALVDVRLANPEALRLAQALIAAGAALDGMSAPATADAPDIGQDPQAVPRRMPDLAADIRWAMDSAALSAKQARRAYDTATGPATTAEAPPRAPTAATGKLAACLNRAALSLSVSAEAQRMMLDLLPEQFPEWYTCSGLEMELVPPSGLSGIFDRDLEYEKAMTDLQRCPESPAADEDCTAGCMQSRLACPRQAMPWSATCSPKPPWLG